MVRVEVLWVQLHSTWFEELTLLSPCSPSGLELSFVTSRSREAEFEKILSKRIMGFAYPLDLKDLGNHL